MRDAPNQALVGALTAALYSVSAGTALAAAFQLQAGTSAELGSAFAGVVSAADTPSTAFNNPAGMTQLPGL